MYCKNCSGISARTSLARAACDVTMFESLRIKSRNGTNWNKYTVYYMVQRIKKGYKQIQVAVRMMSHSSYHGGLNSEYICL